MKFIAVAALAFAATASAWSNDTIAYTTEVVTALTTYCPESTTITHNGYTYTITEVRRILRVWEKERLGLFRGLVVEGRGWPDLNQAGYLLCTRLAWQSPLLSSPAPPSPLQMSEREC